VFALATQSSATLLNDLCGTFWINKAGDLVYGCGGYPAPGLPVPIEGPGGIGGPGGVGTADPAASATGAVPSPP
jgi:hypothetical protein